MKREGFLMERIADSDNLRLAFWKAKRGKEAKADVWAYQQNLDKNLMVLRKELLTSSVSVGNYHYFKIYDPKERQICAAAFPERVLHHALMNICHDNFEKYQIYESYASRVRKGTYAALTQAQVFQKKYKWFMKLDVRKYFDNIDHQILKNLLAKRFKDSKLLTVFSSIIDSYQSFASKGVPIGNLTSQYFANHYLAIGDHFVKENLAIKGYVRYMDDMVLWANDKDELLEKSKKLKEYLFQNLGLELKPFCLNYTPKGLPFLGYLVFPETTKLNSHSRERFIKKLKYYEQNLLNESWNQSEYQRHVIPLISYTNHAESAGFRRYCMQNIQQG